MTTRTQTLKPSTLAAALPAATFREEHHRIVDAPVQSCWDVLHDLRWSELTITRPLYAVRTLGRAEGSPLDPARRIVEAPSPGAPVHEEPPTYSTSGMIGRPWRNAARGPAVDGLAALAGFAESGWLKYGMDWSLTDLGDGRTLVETRTLCEATDASARRAFPAYWALIRPFSGLIRVDVLAALARRAEGR